MTYNESNGHVADDVTYCDVTLKVQGHYV